MRPVRLSRVSNPYGVPGNYAAGVHTGVDFAAAYGTSILGRWVRATAPGVVIVSAYDAKSYGHWVVVASDAGDRFVHGYCHMSERRASVGERVTRGQVLGKVGSTGNSTGPHVHYFENPGSNYSYSAHRKPVHCWGGPFAKEPTP